MFAVLLLITSPILNLDKVGQVYQIVARIDCEVSAGSIDMNGADSTVSMDDGKKKVSLLFSTKGQAENYSKIGVLALETQGGETTLEELTYSSDYVPGVPAVPGEPPIPMLSLVLSQGEATFYRLTPEDDPKKWVWDYNETQVLLHGAIKNSQGACKLNDMSD